MITDNASTTGSAATAVPATPAATATPVAAPKATATVSEPNLRAHGRLSLTDLGDKAAAPETAPAPNKPSAAAAEAIATADGVKPGEPAADAPKPGAQAPAPAPNVLKTKSGREFKDPTELLTAYENSSTEALRLAAFEKTAKFAQEDMQSKLQAANNAILELQSVAGTGLFPGLKSTEDLEAMSEEDRQIYYLDKRDWSKQQEAFRARASASKD